MNNNISSHVKKTVATKITDSDNTTGGVSMRVGIVSAVNGSDNTVDVIVGGVGGTTWTHIKRLLSYSSPAAFDRVVVLVQQPGHGQAGGWAFVIGEST